MVSGIIKNCGLKIFPNVPLRPAPPFGKIHAEPLDGLLTTREPLAMRSGAGSNPGSSILRDRWMNKRTIVYIDGFNLYYGLLRRNAASKWLDLWKLSRCLVSPNNDILAVKYFTSRVNYDPKKPSSLKNLLQRNIRKYIFVRCKRLVLLKLWKAITSVKMQGCHFALSPVKVVARMLMSCELRRSART